MLKLFTICAAVAAAVTPASAANTRTWLSGKGVDQVGCGPIANPCRTLQYAYGATNDGGEINFLDGAGYGNLEIFKSISIVNDGAGVAGILAPAGGFGIQISAASDARVILRGLTIEGAGVGNNGIVFRSGDALTISNVTVQGFTQTNGDGSIGNGIYVRPGSGYPAVTISNAHITDNGTAGIKFKPNNSGSGKIAIDRTSVSRNTNGIVIDNAPGVARSYATITNTVATNNSNYGFQFAAGTIAYLQVQMSSSQAGNNSAGISMSSGATLYLSDVTAATNEAGDIVGTGGSVQTIGNNFIRNPAGSFSKSTNTPY